MAWIPIAMAALGAVSGAEQAKAQKKAQERQANLSAAQTQYSPWTGITPQQFTPGPVSSPLAGAFSGGVQGGLQGMMFSKGMGESAPMSSGPTDSMPQLQPVSLGSSYSPKTQMGVAGGGSTPWLGIGLQKPSMISGETQLNPDEDYFSKNRRLMAGYP